MIYKVLIVAHIISGSGSATISMTVAEFPTVDEANCCVKQFSGNTVIDAFPLNWRA